MLRVAPVLLALVALGGCGGGGAETVSDGPLGVEQALERDGDPVQVSGFLVVDGDGVRLCSLLAESYPPQCGGAVLLVEGLAAGDLPPLERAQGVGWSDGEVTLRGRVDDETLRAAEIDPSEP